MSILLAVFKPLQDSSRLQDFWQCFANPDRHVKDVQPLDINSVCVILTHDFPVNRQNIKLL